MSGNSWSPKHFGVMRFRVDRDDRVDRQVVDEAVAFERDVAGRPAWWRAGAARWRRSATLIPGKSLRGEFYTCVGIPTMLTRSEFQA